MENFVKTPFKFLYEKSFEKPKNLEKLTM